MFLPSVLAAAAVVLAGMLSPARAVPRPAPLVITPVCAAPLPGYAACLADVVTGVRPDAGTAYGPGDLRTAYALPAAPPVGAPIQLVAIVDAGGTATLEADLGVFDARYSLPACTAGNGCLRIVDERGGSSLPPVDPAWEEETSLDVETVHGLCPTCQILLVQADQPSDVDLSTAVSTAIRLGATEVSNSYGGDESPSQTAVDAAYDRPGVAITASSGDNGYGVEWPASAPGVVAVGGTSLHVNPDGSYQSESAWSGAGSGCSAVESAPPWQTHLLTWPITHCGTSRGVADVSADADPMTGVAIYDSTPEAGRSGWGRFGGTSLSAPILASVYALAGGVGPGVEAASIPYAHSALLHDITSGSNGTCPTIMCQAGIGYDGPTGSGAPSGIAAFQSGSLAPAPTPGPTNTPTPTTTPAPTATASPVPARTIPPPPPPPLVPSATPTPGRWQCRGKKTAAWAQHLCRWVSS